MKNVKNQPDGRAPVAMTEQEPVSQRCRISSRKLFGARNEIVIEHNDDEYRLRITSNDKLILTK